MNLMKEVHSVEATVSAPELKPWIVTETCATCEGSREVFDDAPWTTDPVPCPDCNDGTVVRNYLKEAFAILAGNNLEVSVNHLRAMTVHYREHVSALIGILPLTLERTTAHLASMQESLAEIAGTVARKPAQSEVAAAMVGEAA